MRHYSTRSCTTRLCCTTSRWWTAWCIIIIIIKGSSKGSPSPSSQESPLCHSCDRSRTIVRTVTHLDNDYMRLVIDLRTFDVFNGTDVNLSWFRGFVIVQYSRENMITCVKKKTEIKYLNTRRYQSRL